MSSADIFSEQRRVAALLDYAIVGTLPEQDFDDLTFLAAQICQTPIAMINFIDDHQQWSKSTYGIAAQPVPRDVTFCIHTVEQQGLLIAADTRVDERFHKSLFVVSEPFLHFYAGAPLITPDGLALGTLCVLDYQPRQLDELQQSALLRLSRQVVAQLELRRQIKALHQSEQQYLETHQVLQSSTNLLQTVIQGTSDIIFLKDLEGRYSFINQPGAKLFGTSPEEVIGKTDAELFSPEAAEAIAITEGNIIASGQHESLEEHLVTPDRKYTFLTTKNVYRNRAGVPTGIIGIAHDITERVRIERALWSSQQHMAGIVALSTDAIISIDEQQCICLFNRAAEDIFGYKAAEILGQPLNLLIPAHLRDMHTRHVQGFISSQGKVHAADLRGIVPGLRRDGSEFPIEGSISKITVEGAAILTVCLRDMTEPLRVQEQLRLLESAVHHTTEAIVITNANLLQPGPEIVFANPAFLALTGYTEAEILGRTPRLLQGPKTDREVMQRLRAQLSMGQVFHGEAINYRKDGSEYYLEWNTAPLFDDAGKITHFVAVQRDITERHVAEIRMRESKEQLQQYAYRLQNLYDIGQWVLSATSLEMISLGVVRYIQELIPSSGAYVMLFDQTSDRVRTLAFTVNGTDAAPVALGPPLMMEDISPNVRAGRILLDNNIHPGSTLPRSLQGHLGTLDQVRSYMSVPFISKDQVLGALNLTAEQTNAFTAVHLDIAREVTSQMAVAIQNAQLFEQVQSGRDRLATLSRRLIEVQEDERRHLARELHDEIGQALTAINLNLNMIAEETVNPAALAYLEDTNRIVSQLVQQIRTLSLDLRPSMLDDLGLISTLRWYLDRQSQRSGVRIQFSGEEPELPLSPSVATACFRIVQESITNILRYARASKVLVEVRSHDQRLALALHDNGTGFNVKKAQDLAAAGHSLGLLGMQERAVLLGGEFSITSSPDAGTSVQAWFPLGDLPLDRRKNRR